MDRHLYVLDTSVAMAWYFTETFSAAAREWHVRLLDKSITLLVPGLHFCEFANVLRKRVRRGELDDALALQIYELHLRAPLTHAEPLQQTILSTALQYDATAYDAVYIALAKENNAKLLTAERSTTTWVQRLKRQVVALS